VLLDQIQAHTASPPVYLWLQHNPTDVLHSEGAALRTALQRLPSAGRAAVRIVGGHGHGFEQYVENLLEGLVRQEEREGGGGGVVNEASLPWVDVTTGALPGRSFRGTSLIFVCSQPQHSCQTSDHWGEPSKCSEVVCFLLPGPCWTSTMCRPLVEVSCSHVAEDAACACWKPVHYNSACHLLTHVRAFVEDCWRLQVIGMDLHSHSGVWR
jgi:hypothetical protein